jgi:hypothetical protein
MMRKGYRPGDWLVTCQRTGFVVYASEIVKEAPSALLVREKSSDDINPQDFVRGVPDHQGVPFSSPEPTDHFIGPFLSSFSISGTSNVIFGGPNIVNASFSMSGIGNAIFPSDALAEIQAEDSSAVQAEDSAIVISK